jgi:N-acetylglucosamine-6-phosphate deacetylase
MGVGPGVGTNIAAPGFVDLQLNGFGGVDVQSASPESIVEMSGKLAATGVTAYQPTLISGPIDSMLRALDALTVASHATSTARMLSVHLEGPFLSPKWRGAHPLEYLRSPDFAVLDKLMKFGNVAYVTLAPELPGACEMILELRARGVVVAIGHTDATAEEATAGFRAGATVLTHAFNAHRRFAPRDPGPIAAAINEEAWVTVIADGIHLAPLTLMMLNRAAGARVVAISDAMVAAGLGDGDFRFGELDVHVRNGRAELTGGQLAGSTTSLHEEVRCLVNAGLRVEDALAAVTSRPAAVLGRTDLGRLVQGGPADVVILDSTLHPLVTFLGGVEIARAQDETT